MTATTLSIKSQDSSGITYADPANPLLNIRFRFTSVNKTLNGVITPNLATEIIFTDTYGITVGGVSALDALSVRLRVSGSLASKGRLRDILTSMAAQCAQWETENVMQGFRPTTAPVFNDAL